MMIPTLQQMRADEQAMWLMFACLGRVESYLDISCGVGWRVKIAKQNGCKPAIGIERSYDARCTRWATVLVRDVHRPFVLYDFKNGGVLKFDLVFVGADDVRKENVAIHSKRWVIVATNNEYPLCIDDNQLVYASRETAQVNDVWQSIDKLAAKLRVYSVRNEI